MEDKIEKYIKVVAACAQNIWIALRHGRNAVTCLKHHDGVWGCYAVAIVRKADGEIWALERNVHQARVRQMADGFARNNTYLTWVAVMKDPQAHIKDPIPECYGGECE